MSAQDFGKLDEWISSLRAIPKMMDYAAEQCAPVAREAMAAPLAAGQSPDGDAWAPKKEGSGKPYAGAAAKLKATGKGRRIRFVISGPEFWAHIGARGVKARRMLPLTLPQAVAAAIRAKLRDMFVRVMKVR